MTSSVYYNNEFILIIILNQLVLINLFIGAVWNMWIYLIKRVLFD